MFSSLLLTFSLVSLVDSALTKFSESFNCLQFFCDLLRLLSKLSLRLAKNMLMSILFLSSSRLESFNSGIWNLSLLGLAFLLGEEDQVALISCESLNIELETFF